MGQRQHSPLAGRKPAVMLRSKESFHFDLSGVIPESYPRFGTVLSKKNLVATTRAVHAAALEFFVSKPNTRVYSLRSSTSPLY